MKFKHYDDYTKAEWEQLPNYKKETILEISKEHNEQEIKRLRKELGMLVGNFKKMNYEELFDFLSSCKYANVITWYICDSNGDEYVQHSNGHAYPFLHKGDVYVAPCVPLPKGTFKKLGYDIKPFQVLGLVDTTGEYVLSYTCVDGDYKPSVEDEKNEK